MPIERRLFLTILLGYLVAGALYARFTPAWQLPDEPAHYNYIRQVAQAGCCPRIEPGDWSSEYLARLTNGRFAPDLLGELDSVQYEDHHPPLYYMLASLVFKLGEGNLASLRLVSVLLGAGAVVLSYAVSRRILPQQPQVALGTMALVAFLPQHLHMMSAVNNDALAVLFAGLTLLWLLRYLNADQVPTWQLGLIVGLAFLTKLTIYFLAPLAALAICLKWRRSGLPLPELFRSLAVFVLVAGAIGGGWWLRNVAVYGFPDFLGLAAHDLVVADQPRTADYIAARGIVGFAIDLLGTAFKSFWGQFGWMALPLDDVLGGWVYRGFGILLLGGLLGALLACRRAALPAAPLTLLLVMILTVLLQFSYYNLEFQQWQGRYLFPALIPIAFFLAYGIDHWGQGLPQAEGWARWLMPFALCALFALDIYLLFRVIVPGLSP